MYLGLVFLYLCSVTTVFTVCIDDDKYAKSLATPGRHPRAKEEISDVELIDSGLKSKLDQGLDQTELLEKKLNVEKGFSHLGKDIDPKIVAETDKFKGSIALDEELLSKIKHGVDFSELSDEEMKSIVIYLKQLGAGKEEIEEFFFYKKDDEDYEEKAYLDKSLPIEKLELPKKEKSFFKDGYYGDKAGDEDAKTYLAESMVHLKTAADLKEYPNLRPEVEGFVKKIETDKKPFATHLKSLGEEELFKKGVESVKLDDLHSYLKKNAEVEKDAAVRAEKTMISAMGKELLPAMKDIHDKEAFHLDKTIDLKKLLKSENDEEKLIDEWKAGHKDLFKKDIALEDEEAYDLGKFKISEILKGKSSHELDKILKGEDLHYTGGSHAYEQARGKAIQDAKILINDDSLKIRKHVDGAFDFGGDKKAYDAKALFTETPFEDKEHEFSHKIAAGIEKGMHEKEMKKKGIHDLEAHLAGEKVHGIDKKISLETGKELLDETFLSEDVLKALKEMYGSKMHIGAEVKDDEKFFDIDGKLAFEGAKDLYGEKVHVSEDALKAKDFHNPKFFFESDLKNTKLHGDKIDFDTEKAILEEKTHLGEEAMKSKVHGINSGIAFEKGKIHTEELDKKIHGIGSSLHHDHDIAIADDIFKEEKKIHGFEGAEEKSLHNHFGKSHIEHGILSEEGHILHGVDSASKDLHHAVEIGRTDKEIEAGKAKKKVQELGHRFMQFMKNVFGARKCHLVTMRPHELLGIINCISKSKDPLLCEKFAMCEKKMPPQVIAALEKCQKELVPGEMKRCTKFTPLYPSMEIPVKIFQCTVRNTKELLPEEKEKMIDFEECARKVKDEGCSRVRWIRSHF